MTMLKVYGIVILLFGVFGMYEVAQIEGTQIAASINAGTVIGCGAMLALGKLKAV